MMQRRVGAKTTDEAAISPVMTMEEIEAFRGALSEYEYVMGASANLLQLLWSGLAGGHFDGNDSGVQAAIELGRRGILHFMEHEGEELTKLGFKLYDMRQAVLDAAEARA